MTELSSPPRILIIKLSSLGDLFHALPAVHRLKDAWNAEIDWVTQSEYADLVHAFDDVSRVFVFPRRHFIHGIRRLRRELRHTRYDYVLDLQGLFKSALVTALSRGRRKIGPSFHRECSRLFYREIAGKRNRNRHAVDEIMDVVRHLGIEPTPIEFPTAFPVMTPDRPSPRVAFIPRSRWTTKNWPASKFIETGNALIRACNANVYLVGSKEDQAACLEIEQGLERPCRNLCGTTSLIELGGWLQSMDLVISVDSGPLHMAAAVGVPVMALFGATDPLRTGPYGRGHRVIARTDLSCRPCCSRVCRRPERDIACLANLPETDVIKNALDLLSNT